MAAAGDGREQVVKALLEVCHPDGPARGQPPRGQAPLIAAAAAGHTACARLLLQARANVRAMTLARTSAAHLAAARGDAELLQLLLSDRGPEGVATWARDADMKLAKSGYEIQGMLQDARLTNTDPAKAMTRPLRVESVGP